MNNTQHEQLFTDLVSTQAETIVGGDPIVDPSVSFARASYGSADAKIKAISSEWFTIDMSVKDEARDGYPVYAKFDGEGFDTHPSNGLVRLTGLTKFFDRTGANGDGRNYKQAVTFGKNFILSRVRVAIYRAGRPRGVGRWVNL
ncbi:MAG: hypothetical protein Kow00121_52270 [Elainellaceae cyanobacterium]